MNIGHGAVELYINDRYINTTISEESIPVFIIFAHTLTYNNLQ